MGQLGDEEPTANMRIAIGLILQLPVGGGQPHGGQAWAILLGHQPLLRK
jgi:hypothetical protein